jgi:uncharacterized protein with PIN domain
MNTDLDLTPLDLTPIDWDCLRCGETHPMRFRTVCPRCREELRATMAREAKDVEVAEYEPKMNVTPNAVASKD